MDKDEKVSELLTKLDQLLLKQQQFDDEIKSLRQEIGKLYPEASESGRPVLPKKNSTESIFPPRPERIHPNITPFEKRTSFADQFTRKNIEKSDFEKFIGENLISKIGILILVIGVIIGGKLAIEKELVSPITRIILGYFTGIVMMSLAMKLKLKYERFSAVLLSGAIAILYFITFAAYNYYQLIPQVPAFGMMVIFTGFTVVAALKYNKQIIAHLGLVGAYAIPFLLSNNSGNITILFSYIAIINIGVLVLSFLKYWKALFYISFAVTWMIFIGWQVQSGQTINAMAISMAFSCINFFTFYATNLAYKCVKNETFVISDVIILLLNSFIFYGVGCWTLTNSITNTAFLGIFTLLNATVHLVVCLMIYKRKLADQKLFYFLLALVITFITIAIPVQLNGNWITIFWAIEASILFYFATKKNILVFEKLALALVYLAFFSFLKDGFVSSRFYLANDYAHSIPFLNIGFLSALLFIGCFFWMFNSTRLQPTEKQPSSIRILLTYSIGVVLIVVTYYAFYHELSLIFDNLYEQSKLRLPSTSSIENFVYNENYRLLGLISGHIYSMFFATALTLINLKKLKGKNLAMANVLINLLVIILFLTHGLYLLSELRDAYLRPSNEYFANSQLLILARYIAFIFFAALIVSCYRLCNSLLIRVRLKTAFNYLLYIAMLWVLSSELLNLLALNGLQTGYKIGLSILWGTYALFLIGFGIWKRKKYLRIGAMVLFAITLIKLFIYDLTSLNTISKTIVFVSLGVLLLVISFLYNKFKNLIDNDAQSKD